MDPEGVAVAEAEGQRVGQDDAVATDQSRTPMKKVRRSDFVSTSAFEKESRKSEDDQRA
jgi:hypothetical protein